MIGRFFFMMIGKRSWGTIEEGKEGEERERAGKKEEENPTSIKKKKKIKNPLSF